MTILGVDGHAQEYFHVQKTQLIDAQDNLLLLRVSTTRMLG